MIKLNPSQYKRVIDSLKEVTINHLFVRSVIEGKVDGTVYADHAEHPEVFYVYHPYGLSLLFGKSEHEAFYSWLKNHVLNFSGNRFKPEWLQVFPESLNQSFRDLCIGRIRNVSGVSGESRFDLIEEHTRVNFSFNQEKYLRFRRTLSPVHYPVLRTDREMYEQMQGTVLPRFFWKDADQFVSQGIGFSLMVEEKPASTAFSAFIHDHQLELGIESAERFRGKGFAIYTCVALIDYCLENQFEPVWSCRLGNTASYRLAQKLGFEPTFEIPFYRLCC